MSAAAIDPVERLLPCLEGVRKIGCGWIAKCPAHSDRSASLSIAVGVDGRVLLHDFAGCAIPEILAAIGFSLSDLFERRIAHSTSPAERAELHERARQAEWGAALRVLDFESKIVQISAFDARSSRSLDDTDVARLSIAVERIQDIRAMLCRAPKFRPVVP